MGLQNVIPMKFSQLAEIHEAQPDAIETRTRPSSTVKDSLASGRQLHL
jgi:hypothetical protein